ncbi:hypothetical protein ACFGVR_01445 [Mucilaginibacter sp. AW1-3]
MRKTNTRRIFNIFLAVVIVEIFISISGNKLLNTKGYDNSSQKNAIDNDNIQERVDAAKRDKVNVRSVSFTTLQTDTVNAKNRYLIDKSL